MWKIEYRVFNDFDDILSQKEINYKLKILIRMSLYGHSMGLFW